MKKSIVLMLGMVFFAAGCFAGIFDTPQLPPNNFTVQSKQNEANAKEISARLGVPKINRSMDYENVKRRAMYLNQGNNVGYLYLLTENGQVVRESQVLGKVTSLNSYITPMETINMVNHDGGEFNMQTPVVVSAPDIDGTYGNNVDGIFWFTPDGAYQEWNGKYIFSSERLSFQTQPLLIKNQ